MKRILAFTLALIMCMSLIPMEQAAAQNNLVVVLDPGHDNTHAGTQKNGHGEEDMVLKIAQYCKEELEKYNNVTVYMTREVEACVNGGNSVSSTKCNAKRVEFASEKNADTYVSFHLNSNTSSSANGVGVYYPNSNYRPDLGTEGYGLAKTIVEKLTALGLNKWAGGTLIHNSEDETKYPDGSLADYLGVIRRCKEAGIPAVLIEHAFLSNSGDYNNFLSSDEKLKALGMADATAIAEYYGLQKGLSFKSTNLEAGSVAIGNSAKLYYEMTENANITVEIFYGNNDYLKTIVSNQNVGTDEQVAVWDLTDREGNYVANGTYRFTITATGESGEKIYAHKWFEVTGNDPLGYKWTNLETGSVAVGEPAKLYYAVNKEATITVEIFYGNNDYLKTIVSDKKVGTNDQVATWDLTDRNGEYVNNGTYRFTITATSESGETIYAHKWFKVTGNQPLSYKWTNLSSSNVRIGNTADLYYAVNKNAKITIQVFYGNNNFLKTLVSEKSIKTNDQVIRWDLTDQNGNYVENGTYRFTIIATNAAGETICTHKWFTVTGNDPLSYKWTNLDTATVEGGKNISLYYAVNKKANITVQVFYGNNNYLKTLVSGKTVGTNDQVVSWDLKDTNGKYVESGQYRFTIIAVDANGKTIIAHKYFNVKNIDIMGQSITTVKKMVAFYNSKAAYPAFYDDSDAPTIEDFCRIYMEECTAEGVRAEVAFCQSMKETGFLRYLGDARIEQYNFAGLDTTGRKEDGTVDVGRSYPDVRTGIRAHVQRLKAWAVKGTTTSSYQNECIDDDKFDSAWWVNTIIGSAPYVEWLGKYQNPSGYGWATDPEYGYSIKNDYLSKLLSY